MSAFDNATLMITGGTGSFGSTVLKHFLDSDLREIRIFSRDEKKQDDMRHELQAKHPEHAKKVKFYIGDVRNPQSVRDAMPGVDYIFHAAALKQVPSCEFFPMEAVRTNVESTDNVLHAAIDAGVKRVVCLSTDKAASLLATAIEAAVTGALPATALEPTGTAAVQGLAKAMTGYSMSGTGSTIAASVRSSVNNSLNSGTLRSAGVNAMAGLKAGINAGRSGVISAMRSAARAAVGAAKSELKIKSPSKVFEEEVGVMVMRGLGQGVLKESREQARVIRNAARYLTGEAKAGSIQTTSNDNQRTYNNSVHSTIQVQQMVVRDEQDIRALAVEIATLTRRQQRGKGLRMA